MIIVVGGTKGGTGKSTLVTNLGAIAVTEGLDVLLVDADKQASVTAWITAREESTVRLPHVSSVQKFGGLAFTTELKALSKKYEWIFVDAGGYDSEELRASIVVADRLYIPIRPAQFDVWTLPRIIELVQQSQMYNPKLLYSFIINGAHTSPNVKQVEEVMALANEIDGMTFCKTVLHTRIAFSKAPVNGMSVTELKGKDRDSKAVDEILSLYEEVVHA